MASSSALRLQQHSLAAAHGSKASRVPAQVSSVDGCVCCSTLLLLETAPSLTAGVSVATGPHSRPSAHEDHCHGECEALPAVQGRLGCGTVPGQLLLPTVSHSALLPSVARRCAGCDTHTTAQLQQGLKSSWKLEVQPPSSLAALHAHTRRLGSSLLLRQSTQTLVGPEL
jgi:hypothetical protein